MDKTTIRTLYRQTPADGSVVTVYGWVRTAARQQDLRLYRAERRHVLQKPPGRAERWTRCPGFKDAVKTQRRHGHQGRRARW